MNALSGLKIAIQLINAPFTMMTGKEISDALVSGNPCDFIQDSTYLVDNRDGIVLAECLDDGSATAALRMLHPQGHERWTEFASAQN